MRCLKCGKSDEFFVTLERMVWLHTMSEEVLDMVIDGEQFPRADAFACANCGSTEIDVTNADIDGFWKLFNQRVDRKVRNPEHLIDPSA